MTAAVRTLEPASSAEVADAIRELRDGQSNAIVVGSGSSMPPDGDVALSTRMLVGVVDHQPDDLTVVVRAGTTLAELDAVLAGAEQTAVLPETAPDRTVGGVVATGTSGFRRLAYGPTRDRVLGVTVVTGYGEIVTGGGRLVKNVTGYDLSRLLTGSFGSLGVITEVCLKLWPSPRQVRTIAVDDPDFALHALHGPLAVLEAGDGAWAYIGGSDSRVADGCERLGSDGVVGLQWPDPGVGAMQVSVRVPAADVGRAVVLVRAAGATGFIAQHGVGRVDAAFERLDADSLAGLRAHVRDLDGYVVIEAWPNGARPDRWGYVPGGAAIQRRLKALFDPDGVLNVGVLPGGI